MTQRGVRDGPRRLIRSYRRTLPGDRRHLLERYRYVDAARKVVGVGSVGTRAWIVLLLGRDDDDPLFLQVKEARGVGARAVPRHERVRQPRPARRRGPAADAGGERHHARLVPHARPRRRRARLLRPPALGRQGLGARSSSMDPSAHDRLRASSAAGRSPARTPAPATRSRSRATSASGDAFDRAIATFAETYADQNERDYAALKAAVASGRLAATEGL